MVDRALQIADEESLDAVSVRRMAQEFDVTPMALYWHFKNRDEMRAALGDRLIERVEPPERSESVGDYIRAVMYALIESLAAHPSAAELVPLRILSSPRGQQITEQVLGALVEAGFAPPAAVIVARTALQTAVALVTGFPGAELQVPAPERDELRRRKLAEVLTLPEEEFPYLRAHIAEMLNCDDPSDYYRAGVDVFVDGINGLR